MWQCRMYMAVLTDVQPINILFSYLQKHQRVVIWLYDNNEFRLEGFIIVSKVSLSSSLDFSVTCGVK